MTLTRTLFIALAILLPASWTVARAAEEGSTETTTKTTKKSKKSKKSDGTTKSDSDTTKTDSK